MTRFQCPPCLGKRFVIRIHAYDLTIPVEPAAQLHGVTAAAGCPVDVQSSAIGEKKLHYFITKNWCMVRGPVVPGSCVIRGVHAVRYCSNTVCATVS